MAAKEAFCQFLHQTKLFAFRGHHQLGLMTHDLMNGEHIDEAVRRLPADLRNAREQRLKVGFDLFVKKQELPVAQQLSPEKEHPYLLPYLRLIEREDEERRAFRQ